MMSPLHGFLLIFGSMICGILALWLPYKRGTILRPCKENLGHHAAAFTLDTYGHVTETMKKDSSQRMQSYINSVKGKR